MKLLTDTRYMAALAIAMALTACSGDAGGPGRPDQSVASVEIAPPGLVLTVGSQQKLTARVFNAAHEAIVGYAISWTSEAPTIANVAQDGTVSALAAGTTRITATAGGKQAIVNVTVTSQGGGASGTINLNPAVTFQTITGWEAEAQSGHEHPSFPLYKDRLFDLAVNDLGINRLRLAVRSGSEHNVDYYKQWRSGQIDDATWRCVRFSTVNDNNDPRNINTSGFQFSQIDSVVQNVVLPMRARLAARGEKLYLNLLYSAFTDQICNNLAYHHDDSPEEYAEIILATSQYLRSRYGLVPDTWEVILEPDNTTFWRGRPIGEAIVATAARLSAAGFAPRFIAPSTTRHSNALPYFDVLSQQVPAAVPFMTELSYHRYSSPTDTDLQQIASRAAGAGIGTSMLEHLGSGHEDLHKDLKFANVSAWQQFALAYPSSDNGAQYYAIDITNASSPQVNIGSRTRFLRQYFKFIRAGAVRIAASSGNAALDPLAFINANGGYVVVVKATGAAAFTVGGLPPARYGIKYTTASAYDVDHPDITLASGQALSTSIPAAGVLTVYRR